MKRAFTLIELLVVIGIIGLLAGVLLSGFGKSTESARMVKCATNMRNLAMAVRSVSASAQSYQYAKPISEKNERGIRYQVHKGWISYLDKGTDYPLKTPGSFTQPSFAGSDEDTTYALTNGAIWRAISGNRDCYLCPAVVRICHQKGLRTPGWTYQMNARFGHAKKGSATDQDNGMSDLSSAQADRILLFAEIPALELADVKGGKANVSSLPTVKLSGDAGDPAMDGCLLYREKGGNESIGFNHRRGNQIVGHVAFADGHVEAIVAPKNGNFVELTDWLCQGLAVVYQDGAYQEVKDSAVE